MRAGSLDCRLVIVKRAAGARDDFGAPQIVWTDQPAVWASRTDIKDGERLQAAAVGGSVTTRFRTRDNAITRGATTEDRMRHDGELFEIVGKKRLPKRGDGFEFTGMARLGDA
jgi:head-tail adaptor